MITIARLNVLCYCSVAIYKCMPQEFKSIHKTLGLDVHKDSIFCAIYDLFGSHLGYPLIQELHICTRAYRILVRQRTKVPTQMDRVLIMCGTV
jgi:hypothetical protein